MNLESAVLFYVTLLISLVVHEAAHALFALWGGDRTAYAGGQVTLNPMPHIQREPFGTVVLPILMLAISGGQWCFGYATTPIDPHWAHRHPRRAALMSAAGPLANLLLAALAFGVLHLLIATGLADPFSGNGSLVSPVDDSATVFAVARIATVFLLLNLILAIFNLLPWPPLDGAGVLEGLAPRRLQPFFGFIRSQPMLVILGMVAIWQILPALYGPVMQLVMDWI